MTRQGRTRLCAALAAMTALALLAAAAIGTVQNETILVSVGPNGEAGDNTLDPFNPGIAATDVTPDGRYVVFGSDAYNLDDNPFDNEPVQIWRRDTRTGTTILISRANGAAGAFGDADSRKPSISADGNRIAFQSDADNFPDGTAAGDDADVWLRDVSAGTTEQVSLTDATDADLDDVSGAPDISADGTKVAFESDGNLRPADPNPAVVDIWVRDLTDDSTQLVSRATGAGGAGGDENSVEASISADGTKVAFSSFADDLDGDPEDDERQVYLRDTTAGTTTLISRPSASPGGVQGNDDSFRPSISADGTVVAFDSDATNLDAADLSGGRSVYVRDGTGTKLVSINSAGESADEYTSAAAVSGNGRHVAFESLDDDLSDEDTDGIDDNDVFLRDRVAGTTTLISRQSASAGGAAADDQSFRPAISPDGRWVTFSSRANNLSTSDNNNDLNVFLRDLVGDPVLPPGANPQTPVVPDTTAPVFESASLTNRRFAVGSAPTPVTAQRRRKPAPKGTTFRYSLSEAATVTIRIERLLPGRRTGGKCRKPTRKNRKGRRCKRAKRVGTLTRASVANANSVPFSGRIGRRKLAPGSYRAKLTASDLARNVSAGRTLKFTIVRR